MASCAALKAQDELAAFDHLAMSSLIRRRPSIRTRCEKLRNCMKRRSGSRHYPPLAHTPLQGLSNTDLEVHLRILRRIHYP